MFLAIKFQLPSMAPVVYSKQGRNEQLSFTKKTINKSARLYNQPKSGVVFL